MGCEAIMALPCRRLQAGVYCRDRLRSFFPARCVKNKSLAKSVVKSGQIEAFVPTPKTSVNLKKILSSPIDGYRIYNVADNFRDFRNVILNAISFVQKFLFVKNWSKS